MTGPAALGARRCRGCGRLLHARDRCACDTQTVHVITTLGPTPDMPGQRVRAQLGRGVGEERMPHQPESPWRPRASYVDLSRAYSEHIDRMVTDTIRRHT